MAVVKQIILQLEDNGNLHIECSGVDKFSAYSMAELLKDAFRDQKPEDAKKIVTPNVVEMFDFKGKKV